jgi:threonine/homoserine/homoserine lactone efflux protein
MLVGLILSYVISFGLSIFLIIDSGILEGRTRWPVIAGIAALAVVLAFFHVRAQFRRYDFLVRLAQGSEDD